MKHEIVIRLAEDREGARVGELVEGMLVNVNMGVIDWSRVFPHWIVAEVDGSIVGAVQISLGTPIARMENLSLDKALTGSLKAKVVDALMRQGLGALQRSGAQVVTGMVAFSRKKYRKVLEKRGAVIGYSGHTMFMRV